VIPAGVGFIVIYSRLIADESRINTALGGRDDINRIAQQQKDVLIEMEKHAAKIAGLDESFHSLCNKVASRQRVDTRAAKREQEPVDQEEPPQLMFEPPPQQQQQPNNGGQKRMVLVSKSF